MDGGRPGGLNWLAPQGGQSRRLRPMTLSAGAGFAHAVERTRGHGAGFGRQRRRG
jgi:hypothetical protein